MKRHVWLALSMMGVACAEPLPPHHWKLMQWLPTGPPELRRRVAKWEGITLDTPLPSMRVQQDDVSLVTRSASPAMAWASFPLPKGTWSVSFEARIDKPNGRMSVNFGQEVDVFALAPGWQRFSLVSNFPYRSDKAGLYVRAVTPGTTELRSWQVERVPDPAPVQGAEPVAELRLVHPSYRHTLYAFDSDRTVRVAVPDATPVSLSDAGGHVLQISPLRSRVSEPEDAVAFDVSSLSPGTYHLTAGKADLVVSVAPPVADVVDIREGLMRRNGVPWFPLGIYPQGAAVDLAPPGVDTACINLDAQPVSGAAASIVFRMVRGEAGLSDFLHDLLAQGAGHRILAWSCLDEPDLTAKGALLEPSYRMLRDLDPFHPAYTAVHSSAAIPAFMGGTDIMATDPYPIATTEPPIWLVATAMDRARAVAGPDRSIWLVNQAFGLYPFWQRAPSPAEERCMAWLAINHGARGIIYYAQVENLWPHSPDLKFHLEKSPLYGAITELNAGIRLVEPVLLSNEPAPPATLLDDDGSLDVKTWSLRGETYVSVVNVTGAAVTARVQVSGTVATDVLSGRDWPVSGGMFSADLPPLGARFFRLTR